jgi:membrane-associated phospholipid phosphatase
MNQRISAHCEPLEIVNLRSATEVVQPVSRRKISIGVGCGLAALVMALCFQSDAAVDHFVQQHVDEWSLRVAQWIGRWGDFGGVAAFAVALWWTAGRFRWARVRYWIQVMLLAAVLSGPSANVIRVLCGRTRPNSGLVEGWHGPVAAADFSNSPYRFHAFPSAHTAVIAGFLSPVLVAVTRRQRRSVWQWVLAAGSVCGIALMAVARVWAGVHHLSDVIAAVFLGCVCGVFFVQAKLLARLRDGVRGWRVGLREKLFTR